ncbi:hypothetical protein [Nocardiopsis sp. L17-MgMaSL7]|uniref:hypothetical protein n=1 Tax=Nocardiopsis sp. L17-MgMaSL7 TaxID=1938893 RepID=UPI000D719B60|nr:hypothetical protein [Nocardiopsis sp. L17-MgMaSL7]PWV51164.1 hypothetical protein BDW27_107232 [Nocardiopsis sp. L17-MgMaSL7]
MIPRTSRTGTLRAASAACAAVPSAIGLPLLLGAFLAVLWLLCAAPAQADSASLGSGALGAPVSETATATGEALGLGEAPALDSVVPEKVTEPVTTTLGTVHQRLEKRTVETAEAAVSLPEPAVAEVRGFVAEIDRTREETVERGLGQSLPITESRASRASDSDEDEETGADRAAEEDEGSEPAEWSEGHGVHVLPSVTAHHASTAPSSATPDSEQEDDDRATEHQRVQPATGSPAPTANGPAPAPSVAGYLTAAPLPAPAADAVRLAAHRLHTVPADPADDLTVSPD